MGVMVDMTPLGVAVVTGEEAMAEVGEALLGQELSHFQALGGLIAERELKGMPYRAQ
jgi:hypothetical protein